MTTIAKTTAKAPAPRGRKKTHTRPAVPAFGKEAERIAQYMYEALKAPDAPRATPTGYVLGASYVFKMLIDQAERQGADKQALKAQVLAYIQIV